MLDEPNTTLVDFAPTGDRDYFLGTWRLVSYEVHGVNGTVRYPLGQDAVGYLMYTPDGFMSVAIMSRGRANFGGNDMLAGSTQERAVAARTYLSYCGRYDLHADKVVHHIEVSLFPNWVGMDQERFFEMDGETLTLTTAPLLLEGRQQRGVVRWRKVGGTAEMNARSGGEAG